MVGHTAVYACVVTPTTVAFMEQMMVLYESEESESLNETLVAQGVARVASTADKLATSQVCGRFVRMHVSLVSMLLLRFHVSLSPRSHPSTPLLGWPILGQSKKRSPVVGPCLLLPTSS